MKIKMYNVGFGEAVLLKKAANGRQENLLVDFGSDTPENCIADIGQTISKNDNVTTEIYMIPKVKKFLYCSPIFIWIISMAFWRLIYLTMYA